MMSTRTGAGSRFRRWMTRLFRLGLAAAQVGLLSAQSLPVAAARPRVSNVHIVNQDVARYEKFEVQFDLATSAENVDLPYDTAPPPGVDPGIGVTVDGLFSNDNWQTVIVQPAFFDQPYTATTIGGRDHLTPDGAPRWSIRFAPQEAGPWQFRIRAQDSSGMVVYPAEPTRALGFEVAAESDNPYIRRGFLRVSASDPRYFEFEDGTPFIGVGFNESFDSEADAEQKMKAFEANGIDFVRVWLSSSSINGSQWSPWTSHHLPADGYLPSEGLDIQNTYNGGDVSWRLSADNPCLFADWTQGGIPVEPNTTYTVSARVMLSDLTGPAAPGPWGFVVKQADWLGTDCDRPGRGAPMTPRIHASSGWTTVTGTTTTGPGQYWMDYLYMVRENATGGSINVDQIRVWRSDDPAKVNILREPDANSHLTFDPMASASWDAIFDTAARYGVYLKVVIDEKNEWIRNRIGPSGQMSPTPNNDNFYAAPGTKVRWLQEAWWRYITARWGYSTAIHSFEYVNEGDPFDGRHYDAANAMAAYFDEHDPSQHMATTSFWHSFPNKEFWSNSDYPDIDYADIHAYISTGWGLTASFIAPELAETRKEDVRTGNTSLHVVAANDLSRPITPRGLVIRGPGEWIVRYWMKASSFTADCPHGTTGGMERVRWRIDGGTYAGGKEGVVPGNLDGQDFVCTSPAGSFGWTQLRSDRDRDGAQVPVEYRLVLTDSAPHEISLWIENTAGRSGDAWIDDVELVSPAGKVVPVIGQFDSTPMNEDTAWFNAAYGELLGGASPVGSGKPLVRGETGIDSPSAQDWDRGLTHDMNGIWLHNNVWGQVNPGGMYDLFWWATETIKPAIYSNYLTFRNFMDGISINNGHFHDAGATTSDPNLRAWGQRDDTNGNVFLWIQNKQHTWKRVVYGPAVPAIQGVVVVPDVLGGTYQLEWWDTYKTESPVFRTEDLKPVNGSLVITLPESLKSDVAVKIRRIEAEPATDWSALSDLAECRMRDMR